MFVDVTADPIDLAAVLARVGDPCDGAVLLFVGAVRDHNDGRAVSGVGYEAYRPMASEVLHAISDEASRTLGTDRIAVVHRVGELSVGEASVAIAVSSPHRAEAFAAARQIIEEIKRRLPVWKYEHYTAGDGEWLDGVVPRADGAP